MCPLYVAQSRSTPPPPRGSRRLQIWVKIQTEPTSPCGNNGDIFIRIRGASADAQMHKSTNAEIHKCTKLNAKLGGIVWPGVLLRTERQECLSVSHCKVGKIERTFTVKVDQNNLTKLKKMDVQRTWVCSDVCHSLVSLFSQSALTRINQHQ